MIGRLVMHASALVVGVVIGAGLVLATGTAPGATPDPAPQPSTRPTPDVGPHPGPGTVSDTAGRGVPASPMPRTAGAVLLAWTVGGLPDGFSTGTASIDEVRAVTEVTAGGLDLTASHDRVGTVVDQPEDGWSIPLDGIAIDPSTFSAFAPTAERPVLERLEPGTVILGETSAALRRIEVGGRLTLGGDAARTVVGIVDDATVAAAEVVLHEADALARDMEPSYVLLRHEARRPTIEAQLRQLAGDRPIRVRAPGETPFLRHGDAVLPQVIVKQRYGEFTYRPPASGARAFEVDPDWVDEHIVTRDVPILGVVTCHRAAIEPLDALLAELERRGLGHTVDPAGYQGCWHPRLISVGGDPSRHSWGIAIDLNADGNPTGTGSGQPEALVEAFTRAGWGWGGTWLVPDPMHFELVDEPSLPIKVRP